MGERSVVREAGARVATGATNGLRRSGFGRFADHLSAAPVGFGETATPVVETALDGLPIVAKLEGCLPTGSFKDRGSAVLVGSLVKEGVRRIVCDSSGNAGASFAAYCARAGIGCQVHVPASTSPGKLAQARAYGAEVVVVAGTRAEATASAIAAADAGAGRYVTHLSDPRFIEGTQTFALELHEQLGGAAPDAIVVPAGGATLLLGVELGYAALKERGLVDRMPRLYGIQSERCAPLARAFAGDPADADPLARAGAPSIAEGICIASPPHLARAVHAVRASGGALLAVEEDRIHAAERELALRGLYVEPTGAVGVSGALRLAAVGELARNETVVVALTGNGLKAS